MVLIPVFTYLRGNVNLTLAPACAGHTLAATYWPQLSVISKVVLEWSDGGAEEVQGTPMTYGLAPIPGCQYSISPCATTAVNEYQLSSQP